MGGRRSKGSNDDDGDDDDDTLTTGMGNHLMHHAQCVFLHVHPDCMQSRKLPICDVEIGHRSATVCHLGNLVARLGRPVKWDPVTESCPGDAEAQAMTDKEYRDPWTH